MLDHLRRLVQDQLDQPARCQDGDARLVQHPALEILHVDRDDGVGLGDNRGRGHMTISWIVVEVVDVVGAQRDHRRWEVSAHLDQCVITEAVGVDVGVVGNHVARQDARVQDDPCRSGADQR